MQIAQAPCHFADPLRTSSRKAAPKLLGSLGTLDLGPWHLAGDLDGDLEGDLDEDLDEDLDGGLDGGLDGDHTERELTLPGISASIGE